MKAITTILILASVFLPSLSHSQIYIQDINALTQDLNLNELKEVSIIEVYLYKVYKKNWKLFIDYGQRERTASIVLDKPNGKAQGFKSKMHVLNYFENNGWQLIDINSESSNNSDAKTSYYFRKK